MAFITSIPGLIKAKCSQFFWAWVVYQTIKGILTTSIIWIPLFYAMMQS